MKKGQFKKLMAAVLTAAMVAGLAGCGNNDSTPSDQGSQNSDQQSSNEEQSSEEGQGAGEETPDEEGDLGKYTVLTDENGEPYDLGGMEIVLRDWWTDPDKPIENPSAYNEARDEYREWIQETYNFTFVQKQISDFGSTPEDFVNYATTGGDENYLFILRPGAEFISAMKSGLMWDLSKLDCLDFTESKWGNKTHEELASMGDAIYGMSGEFPEAKGGMYFNKRLLKEAGIDPQEIYDLQENMEWTWEKFEEMCQKVAADTDNDGVIDRYAMANFTSVLYPLAVYSNGGEFIGKDENGNLYNALESDATMEALNWALDMLGKYEMTYPEDAAWDYWITAYINGEACFMADEAYRAGQMEDMKDDFGFVCFPMGPRMDDYTNAWMNNPVVIPACYDEEKAWKLAFAYNLWTEMVPGYTVEEAFKSNYYKSFRDTESVDLTIARLETNGFLTYHTLVPGLDLGPDLFWALNKDNTPAQQAETIRPVWAAYLEEINK